MLLYIMNIDIFDKATELNVIQSQTKDFFLVWKALVLLLILELQQPIWQKAPPNLRAVALKLPSSSYLPGWLTLHKMCPLSSRYKAKKKKTATLLIMTEQATVLVCVW